MDDHKNLISQLAPPVGRPARSAPPNSTGQAFGAQRVPGASGRGPAERTPDQGAVRPDETLAGEQPSTAEQALAFAADIARELAFLDGRAAADYDSGDPAAFVTTAEQMITRHGRFASAYRTFLAASLNQSGRMPGTLYTPPKFTEDLARGDRGSW
jgi:hypothetical protein